MSNSYEADILTWSERQADLLRRVGAGEKVNDQVDWTTSLRRLRAWGAANLLR
jgi:hypothetical protein